MLFFILRGCKKTPPTSIYMKSNGQAFSQSCKYLQKISFFSYCFSLGKANVQTLSLCLSTSKDNGCQSLSGWHSTRQIGHHPYCVFHTRFQDTSQHSVKRTHIKLEADFLPKYLWRGQRVLHEHWNHCFEQWLMAAFFLLSCLTVC